MGDPLSVAASIAGLIGVSIQVIQISTKFKNKTRNIDDFIGELTALSAVLKRLRDFLSHQPAVPPFDNVSALITANTQCERKLKEVFQKLNSIAIETNKFKRALDTILWPFSEKEHQ